jgi:hypothetical protein
MIQFWCTSLLTSLLCMNSDKSCPLRLGCTARILDKSKFSCTVLAIFLHSDCIFLGYCTVHHRPPSQTFWRNLPPPFSETKWCFYFCSEDGAIRLLITSRKTFVIPVELSAIYSSLYVDLFNPPPPKCRNNILKFWEISYETRFVIDWCEPKLNLLDKFNVCYK